MKKLTKLAAVFAALMLALSCFVACSNGSDDGAGNQGNGGSGNGGNGGSTSAKDLQGLWIDKEESDPWGWYFVGNTMYQVQYVGGTYYYIEDDPISFSVSGNKIVADDVDGDELHFTFTVSGNTMNFTMSDGVSFDLKKVNVTPTKITYSDLEELLD